MPLKRMSRLTPLLAPERRKDGSGADDATAVWKDARFEARFSYDEQGLVTIRLKVEAELPLICQRSLLPYQERVRRSSVLAVIEEISGQELIPEAYDPVLVEQGRLAMQDLVEEELLLAVPQVPKNPDIGEIELSTDGEVRSSSDIELKQSHRPFADLAGLMKENFDD